MQAKATTCGSVSFRKETFLISPFKLYKVCVSGFPPSGKVREKCFLLEIQGISIFFVESQGNFAPLNVAYRVLLPLKKIEINSV